MFDIAIVLVVLIALAGLRDQTANVVWFAGVSSMLLARDRRASLPVARLLRARRPRPPR